MRAVALTLSLQSDGVSGPAGLSTKTKSTGGWRRARVWEVAAAADLDLGDFLMLRSIELGVDTPGGLARDLGFNPAVVSRALTKLAKAGLIDRRIDSGDSRRSRLELTKEGLRTNAAIAARIRPGLAQRLQRLNAHQIQTLLESFAILTADPVEST